MFHHVFGHVPLLNNYHFSEFFETIGRFWGKKIVAMLGIMYQFTVEFGLIKINNNLKIFGGGIISSDSETQFSVSTKPKHISFDAELIMNTSQKTIIFKINIL